MHHCLDENTTENSEKMSVEILSRREYEIKHLDHSCKKMLLGNLDNNQYCKADLLQTCIIGTFVIPDKADLVDKEVSFGYYLDQYKLLFIDDLGTVQTIIEKIKENQIVQKRSAAHFFFEFLEYLVRDEVQFLQDYEGRMTEMEEELLGDDPDEIPVMILKCRKELLHLNSYYNQLIDMSETLKENYNGLLTKADADLFRLFSDRIERLAGTTRDLREYALQIREMYQTHIDLKQNQVMKFLTVVTTIFMPLTLITGWYGMNFSKMPELYFKHSYLVVIILSLIIVAIEVWFFKKKKWFQ